MITEKVLIAAVLDTGKVDLLDPAMFIEYRPAAEFIVKHSATYGQAPDRDMVEKLLPDGATLPPAPQPPEFYRDKLADERFWFGVGNAADLLGGALEHKDKAKFLAGYAELGTRLNGHASSNGHRPPVGRSYKEAKAFTPEEIPWYLPGWIAPGRLTLLSGKAKEAGKTTLLARLFQKIADGEPFLGQPTTPTKIVHVSEEQLSTLMETATMVGVDDRDDVFVISQPDDLPGASWGEIMAAGLTKALEVGAGILVFDTFANLAGLAGKDEWLPGPMLDCLKPLRSITAAHGLAVVVVFHHGHDDGHPRGSSAVIGLVDIWLALRRTTDGRDRCRVVTGIGRGGQIPAKLTIEADEEWEYRLTDAEQSRSERSSTEDTNDVLFALEDAPDGLTVAEIANETGIPLATAKRILGRLKGQVWCSGTGTRGDPHRFSRPELVTTDSEEDV